MARRGFASVAERPKDFPIRQDLIRRALDLLRTKNYGDLITYNEVGVALTVDGHSPRAQDAVRAAGRKLLQDDNKLLVNVRDRGYQIARPNEHAPEAARLRQAARRRLRRAVDSVVHVALDSLTPQEVAAVLTEQVRAGLTLAFERRVSRVKSLPQPKQSALPSGKAFLQMITKGSNDPA